MLFGMTIEETMFQRFAKITVAFKLTRFQFPSNEMSEMVSKLIRAHVAEQVIQEGQLFNLYRISKSRRTRIIRR